MAKSKHFNILWLNMIGRINGFWSSVFNFMVMTLTSLCLKKTTVLQGKEYIMCFRRLHFDSIKNL